MVQTYSGRWQVIEPLGEGGQAHTFLVSDLKGEGDIKYVLKRLKNLKRIDHFKREIEAVRMLTHENVVRLIDFDLDARKPYLVTEFCSGGSLTHADPFWQRSPIQAFRLFQEVCQGLA